MEKFLIKFGKNIETKSSVDKTRNLWPDVRLQKKQKTSGAQKIDCSFKYKDSYNKSGIKVLVFGVKLLRT